VEDAEVVLDLVPLQLLPQLFRLLPAIHLESNLDPLVGQGEGTLPACEQLYGLKDLQPELGSLSLPALLLVHGLAGFDHPALRYLQGLHRDDQQD